MAFISHFSPPFSASRSASTLPHPLCPSRTYSPLRVNAQQSPTPPSAPTRPLNRRAFLHRALALGFASSFVSLPLSTVPSHAETSTDSTASAPKMAEVQIQDLKVGEGASPKKGDLLFMHYTLTLGNFADQGGKMIDSSRARGKHFSYNFDSGKVIKGWDEGVRTMKVGGKRRLIIPSELGYGPSGIPPTIPGGATLYFEIELDNIRV